MTKTNPISIDWLRAEENGFSAFNITVEALSLINKSETLKAGIRAYAVSPHVSVGKLSATEGAGEYNIYTEATVSTPEKLGFLHIAADHFSTPEGTIRILAHEIEHFRVEEQGAVIANARANALNRGDKSAYEAACNLTEGYAKYNEVKVRDEIIATIRAEAAAEGRPLTSDERRLENRWTGVRPYESFDEGKDYNIVKSIEEAAGAYGQLLTTKEIADAAAFALGENNKSNLASTTKQTYLEFCRDSANDVLKSGETPASELPQERLETIYDAQGAVTSSSVTAASRDGDETVTTFDASGRTTQVIERDGAQDNGDYASRATGYDAAGRPDWMSVVDDSGGTLGTDYDQENERAERVYQQYTDAAGRLDWVNVVDDNGGKLGADYDQLNERSDRSYMQYTDAAGQLDWVSVVDDNGGTLGTDYDQANERAERVYQQYTDAAGRLDWVNVVDDNGGKLGADYDQLNERSDRSYMQYTDAAGRLDWVSVVDDNGGTLGTDYDQANERAERVYQQYTDAAGRLDWVSVLGDDGGTLGTDYDQAGERSEQTYQQYTDAAGNLDWYQRVMDDGSRLVKDYDQANESILSIWEEKYDAQGEVEWTKITYDNGRVYYSENSAESSGSPFTNDYDHPDYFYTYPAPPGAACTQVGDGPWDCGPWD